MKRDDFAAKVFERAESDAHDHVARRSRQRELSRAIGDGTDDKMPLAPSLSLDDMLQQMAYVADGARVVHRAQPHSALPLGEFKLLTRASMSRDGKKLTPTADLWVEDPARITVHTLTYRPGSPEFTTDPEGARAVNLWRPPIRPNSTSSVAPFLEHVTYLVPVAAEREPFLNWLAHIEQKPGVLPHSHYLMVTPQTGIGRNWLASLMARVWAGSVRLGFDLMGSMRSGFNGPLSRRLLVIVDELKAADTGYGSGQQAQALKAMLTAEHRTINPKYGRQHIEFNSARWLMFSQHYDALPLERADRRIIVIANPTERCTPDYYARLYSLLDDQDFINAVARWLAQRDLSGFNPGEPAPPNEAKTRAIESNLSDIERALIELRDGTSDEIMTAAQIREYLMMNCGIGSLPPRALASAYAGVGFVPCRAVVRQDGKRIRVVALRNGDALRDAPSHRLLALLTGQSKD